MDGKSLSYERSAWRSSSALKEFRIITFAIMIPINIEALFKKSHQSQDEDQC